MADEGAGGSGAAAGSGEEHKDVIPSNEVDRTGAVLQFSDDIDRQSLSRSMSRASSQSTDGIKITTTCQEISNNFSNHIEEAREAGQSEGGSARYMENMSSLDPVSDSKLNVSTNDVASDNVSIQNDVQDQSPLKAAQNGITNTVPNLAAVIPDTGASSHDGYTAKPSETLPAPSVMESNPASKTMPQTSATPAPRSRLPNDKVGILEDRIKEDPRGDLEAWLGLVEEHKRRAKIDDARSVYERFLVIFPSAVCGYFLLFQRWFKLLIMFHRQKYGLPMRRLKTKQGSGILWIKFCLVLCLQILIFLFGPCI